MRKPLIGSFQTEDFSAKESEESIDVASDSDLKYNFPLFIFLVFGQLN
jgi:hypothetical protein